MLKKAAFSAALFFVLAGNASAWTPPMVGKACLGQRGAGPQQVAIAGTYLGGRPVRDGIVDRKSFQGCFASLDRCESWLAGKALSHPLQPGYARCTPVIIR